jgi:hypothetical protein
MLPQIPVDPTCLHLAATPHTHVSTRPCSTRARLTVALCR